MVLPECAVAALAGQAAHGAHVTVDLNRMAVTAPDETVFPFGLDPLRREMLLAGTDELGLTLIRTPEIVAWQQTNALHRPWALPRNHSEAS